MNAEPEADAQLEIGHVLFIDIVGYSKRLVDEQSEISDRLNQIVRSTSQFRAAEAEGKSIPLPTGDGMVRVNVVNLCTAEVGNVAVPGKFVRAKQEQDAAEQASTGAAAHAATVHRRKIALLAGCILAMLALGVGFWIFSQRKAATAILAA